MAESEDIINVIKKRRELSLKRSIDMANKPRSLKKKQESRSDKI